MLKSTSNMRWWLVLLVGLALALPASAHEWKTDGKIMVLLHAEPGDDPVVGEPARLFLYVKDEEEQFDPALCDCRVRVTGSGMTVFDDAVGETTDTDWGSNVLEAPVTFPRRAVYTVALTGAPKAGAGFAPFALDYTMRVERVGEGRGSLGRYAVPGAVGGVVLLVLGIIGRDRWRKRRYAQGKQF